ncbi:hypothetical protein NUSPORA_00277 [Nucleospora cyclopteri]
MNNIDKKEREKTEEDKYDFMPDLPSFLYNDQHKNRDFSTEKFPPVLSTTNAVITEEGSSSPYLIRSTIYGIPDQEGQMTAIGVPFSLLLTPFHDKAEVVEFEKLEKCPFCRSFANKFTIFSNGNTLCNICGSKISVTDQDQLSHSSIDLSKPIPLKKIPPTFVFVLDLSCGLLMRNALNAMHETCNNDNFRILYKKVVFLVLNNGVTTFAESSDGFEVIKLKGEIAPKFCSSSFLCTDSNLSLIFSHIESLKFEGITRDKKWMDVLKNICLNTAAAKVAVFSSQNSSYNFEEFLESHKNVCINLFKPENRQKEKTANSLAKLAFYSSGAVFSYNENFENVVTDLMQTACTKSLFNLNILVKPSNTIAKTDVIAPTLNGSLSNLYVNHMDSNSTVMFNLCLKEKGDAFIQAQINYTDYDGRRKLRILNVKLEGTNGSGDFYNGLCVDAIFASLVKQKLDEDINIDTELVKMLAYYRKISKAAGGQLIIPDHLKILPVLVQAYCKKTAVDSLFLYKASCEQILKYFYPRMISLSAYSVDCEPKAIRLSLRNISEGEIYVVENSREILFYFSRGTDEQLIAGIFRENVSLTDLSRESFREDTEEGALCAKLVDEICYHYNYFLKVTAIQAGDLMEAQFISMMVEDAINDKPSYIDYIYKLHFNVKNY